jgi:sporulation protein YlmC with PRC-barrel domain
LKFQHDSEKNKDYVIFDVTEETLKKTPGFDKDHWPDMADRTWMTTVDRHHGIDIKAGNTEVHVRTNNDAERRDVRTPSATAEQNWQLHRASQAVGMKVKNANDEKLGKVEDIVVATGSGEIRYLALSFGGFLGIGDKYFAVPWDAVMLEHKDKEHFVMFDVTKEQLENAQGFDKDHWPDFGNDKWAAANDAHYTAQRRNGTTGQKRVK